MNFRKLGSIDLNTGEILDGVPVYVQAKVKWNEGFFMGIQDAFIEIAKDKDLSGRPKDVLMYLFGKLGFENYICVQQKDIASDLNLEKAQVSKCIKALTKKGIIIDGPKLGRTKTFKLNSQYGWKGRIKNLALDRTSNHLKLVKG